jgi:hypothetical protein
MRRTVAKILRKASSGREHYQTLKREWKKLSRPFRGKELKRLT